MSLGLWLFLGIYLVAGGLIVNPTFLEVCSE